ncbi:MAG: DUF2779 domain-containing protein [Desulfitobacteriia bacterium]|jgi:hypothetical protein
MRARYLTKSRFQLAMECPTKLFYTDKAEYADQKIEDSFLLALADGGFQVGELAKCYYPGGYEIDILDYEKALFQTAELLKKDKVIIYEAAFKYENLFIRADILVKNYDHLDLVEVKAKSFNSSHDSYWGQKGGLKSEWKSYLLDTAFQKYVINRALPDYTVSAHLMMADKNAVCPTDGLNQKFKIYRDSNGRKRVAVSSTLREEDLCQRILCLQKVDDCCDHIYRDFYPFLDSDLSFSDLVHTYAEYYSQNRKIPPIISRACAGCEFKATEEELQKGLKSGYFECWHEAMGWTMEDLSEQTIFDIWNLNYRKKDSLLAEGRIKLKDIIETDINPVSDGKPGISVSERQWLQIQKSKDNDSSPWVDREGLLKEMGSWVFPLHFIDFETAMVAIPFNNGRHPYEGIAFQYSHHVVYENGLVEHRGQYLNAIPGLFPNYDFIRNLKAELEQDDGSIFRYAPHENNYLNHIYRQLQEDQDMIPDREQLCRFIRTITQSVNGSPEQWVGHRNMIDMWELVKRYYYDPAMKGSNSIKVVLPSILNCSSYLQEKYSKPIYGASGGIKSLNFKDWIWIKYQDGKVIDPYKLLPKMFTDVTDKDFALLSDIDELRDGGAAMTVYARMQFEEMADYERSEICKALLKYCELIPWPW